MNTLLCNPIDNAVIVRVQTDYWSNGRGLFQKKSLLFLKRKSTGHNFIEEDASCAGPDMVIPKITNLDECDDGVYQVITINEYRDWETGYVEDWDYKLVPFSE